MMGKKYRVRLTESERTQLFDLISSGVAPARQIMRERVLLKADESLGAGWVDWQICTALDITPNTVARIRQQFVQEGLESTLRRKPPQREYPRRLQGEEEAHLIALACSTPPDGHQRWTLRLLAQRMVELGYVDQVSHETVRQMLKNELKPWLKQEWCIPPEQQPAFVWRMEDILALYAQAYDPLEPMVCLDESFKILQAERRQPLPLRPGKPQI